MERSKKGPDVKFSPGLMINLNEKYRKLLPSFIDGLHVTVNKNLSSHFKATHRTSLSSITPGTYRFGATYVGTKKSAQESFPVLTGDIDSGWNMNANMSHLFGSRFKVKFESQMSNGDFQKADLSTHYLGDNCTASVMLLRPNLLDKTGGIILQYLQNVTSKWALGAEFTCMKDMKPINPSGLIQQTSMFSQVAVCARYTNNNNCWSSHLSMHNILLTYYAQASEQLSIGMEINTNFKASQSTANLAFRVDLKERGVVCKGMINTDLVLGSVFEKKIADTPITFTVSCNINHTKSNFRLGCGILVE